MTTKKEFVKKVADIQKQLKAPKSQFNKFGGYNYRNQEDILEAVKPLLGDMILTISDEMVIVGDRIYVKAISTITDGEHEVSNVALAREPEDQKGMSASQVTGSVSSYARKYSLNGLFLIDDTKDADTDEVTELGKKGDKPKSSPKFARKGSTVSTEPEVEKVTGESEPPKEEEVAPTTRRSFRRK